jgi:hypothetical protein
MSRKNVNDLLEKDVNRCIYTKDFFDAYANNVKKKMWINEVFYIQLLSVSLQRKI